MDFWGLHGFCFNIFNGKIGYYVKWTFYGKFFIENFSVILFVIKRGDLLIGSE